MNRAYEYKYTASRDIVLRVSDVPHFINLSNKHLKQGVGRGLPDHSIEACQRFVRIDLTVP